MFLNVKLTLNVLKDELRINGVAMTGTKDVVCKKGNFLC